MGGRNPRGALPWPAVPGLSLVISNPPHGPNPNVAVAAPLLRFQPESLRGKVRYPVPEIWLAHSNRDRLGEIARALAANDLRVVVVPGDTLAAVPPPAGITRFTFENDGLCVWLGESRLVFPYDEQLLGVYCTVREPARAPPFLDIYAYREGRILRLTAEQGTTDFRGVLDAAAAGPGGPGRRFSIVGNVHGLVSTSQQRFTRLRVDRRLHNMLVREQVDLPRDLVEQRAGYSFGTRALNELLELLHPDLPAVPQTDLSSRLVLLTYVGETE